MKKIIIIILLTTCGYIFYVNGIRIPRCTTPTLPHGNVKTIKRAVIRFTCATGFTLIGNKYATCEQRKWDSEVPYCVKAGCPKIPSPDHGMVLIDNRFIARLFCGFNYETAGNLASYCDGVLWDRSLGTCRQTGIDQEWCDFETKNLCGWQTESTTQFLWTQRNGNSAYQQMRNAPLHDHTTKVSLEGHYMLLESVNNNYEGQTYLVSPIFRENPYMVTCFRFYYHKTGNLGSLTVYIKPISIELNQVLTEPKYKYTQITYLNNTSQWRRIIFVIKEKFNENFQIIIEGKNVMTPREHLAIDDVAYIYDDMECIREYLHDETTEKPDEDEVIFETLSCVNRCNETKLMERQANIIRCDCAEGCDTMKTCCNDYLTVCGLSTETDTDNEIVGDGNGSATTEFNTYNYGIVRTVPSLPLTTLPSITWKTFDFIKSTFITKRYDKNLLINKTTILPLVTGFRTRYKLALTAITGTTTIPLDGTTPLDHRKLIEERIITGKNISVSDTKYVLKIFIFSILTVIIILLIILTGYKYKYKIGLLFNYNNVKNVYNKKNKMGKKRHTNSSMNIYNEENISNRSSMNGSGGDGTGGSGCSSNNNTLNCKDIIINASDLNNLLNNNDNDNDKNIAKNLNNMDNVKKFLKTNKKNDKKNILDNNIKIKKKFPYNNNNKKNKNDKNDNAGEFSEIRYLTGDDEIIDFSLATPDAV